MPPQKTHKINFTDVKDVKHKFSNKILFYAKTKTNKQTEPQNPSRNNSSTVDCRVEDQYTKITCISVHLWTIQKWTVPFTTVSKE